MAFKTMNSKKTKSLIFFFYFGLLIFFYYFLFKFNINDYNLVEIVYFKKEILIEITNNNFIKVNLLLLFLFILWTIFLGFGFPPMVIVAFLFDPIHGTLLVVVAKTIGAGFIYIFSKNFFKNRIKKINILKKSLYKKMLKLIKKKELSFLIIFRLIPGIPVQVCDLLPILINVKFKNYILSKFLGSLIPHYIIINLLSNFILLYDPINKTDFNFDISVKLIFSIMLFVIFIFLGGIIKDKVLKSKRL